MSHSPARDPHAPVPGSYVGPWIILERLDSGSFGVVFRARRAGHPEAPPVALKMAKQPNDPRFMREAELLQRVQHPCVPQYEDMGLWTSLNGPPLTDGGEPVEERMALPPSAMATVCLELEALTLRLLSEAREARGTAKQLAQEAAALAQTALSAADAPILPTPSAVPTEDGAPERGEPASGELSDTDRAAPSSERRDTSTQRVPPLQ